MANVTIRDVAREAEVSITTVSQILRENARYQFHPDTVERVREVAERLGYQAHAAARLLRQQNTKMLGLVVRLTVHPHLNRLLVAVHDEIRRQGYDPVLCEPNQLIPTHSHAPFPSPEMLTGIFSLDLTMEQKVPEFYENLQRRLPVIALYPVASACVHSVCTDIAPSLELVVGHLHDLGHRYIAFNYYPDTTYPGDILKMRSMDKALQHHGLDPNAMLRIPIGPAMSISEIAEASFQYLRNANPRPTAMICFSDEVALATMGRLGAIGWRFPDDLSFTGYDGIDFGFYHHPTLTTIVQDVDRIAGVAVKRMLRLIENPDCEQAAQSIKQWIEPRLVVGTSTAPPRQ